nr:extradiol ring-cleavage dioxygenase [Novosphingobium flavum]
MISAAQRRLAQAISRARLDVLVVVGDDQGELLDRSNMPAVAIYNGAELANGKAVTGFPEWQKRWREAAALDPARHYPGAPDFANDLIGRLIEREIDVSVVNRPAADGKGIGHSWAFVANRLMVGVDVPIVPVIINTWYGPNVPTPARCFAIGQAIRAAIENDPRDLRVGIAAAGGLSHTLLNEELDRSVIAALQTGDAEVLTTLPRKALSGGSAQILDWIVMAGAVSGLANKWIDYFPAYRSLGGTGAGLAFAAWS